MGNMFGRCCNVQYYVVRVVLGEVYWIGLGPRNNYVS